MNISKLNSAYLGSLAADAMSMPVHWYYDRAALKREYGVVDRFIAPNRFHSGSFMGKSEYRPLNSKADIFHDQAKYLGTPYLHYHLFLKAGENTLNFQLAKKVHELVLAKKGYSDRAFLDMYVKSMLTPGWHRDTYLEGYHKAFFQNLARGFAPENCGVDDDNIGGLAAVPALIAALVETKPSISSEEVLVAVRSNVALTHSNLKLIEAAETLANILLAIGAGASVREAIAECGAKWLPITELKSWLKMSDLQVIGERYKPSCPIQDSMPGSLYLAWKYHDDFAAGLSANAMTGGENCHRASVVGGILGAANGPLSQQFLTT